MNIFCVLQAIGGNIATGSPISDLIPLFMASNSTITLASVKGGC